jgi:hypothetical protein
MYHRHAPVPVNDKDDVVLGVELTAPLAEADGDAETVGEVPPMAGTMALMETSRVHAPPPVAAVKPTVAVALPSTAAMSTASVCA